MYSGLQRHLGFQPEAASWPDGDGNHEGLVIKYTLKSAILQIGGSIGQMFSAQHVSGGPSPPLLVFTVVSTLENKRVDTASYRARMPSNRMLNC